MRKAKPPNVEGRRRVVKCTIALHPLELKLCDRADESGTLAKEISVESMRRAVN
jgi:hypothetical protein